MPEVRGARTFGIARCQGHWDHEVADVGLRGLPEITNLRIKRSLEGRPRDRADLPAGPRHPAEMASCSDEGEETLSILCRYRRRMPSPGRHRAPDFRRVGAPAARTRLIPVEDFADEPI